MTDRHCDTPRRDPRGGPVAALRWAIVAALVTVASSACAGAGSATSGPSVPVTPESTTADHVAVPLAVAHNANGANCAVAAVRVGGGRPVRVVVDTGAPGLTVPGDAVGPDAQPTGRHYQAGFVNGSFPVDEVRGQVAIGGVDGPIVVSTPQPIEVESTQSPLHLCGDAEGNLGIGAGGPGPQPTAVQSPLVQLRAPLSDGFELALKESTGRLTIGKPALSARSTELPLLPQNGTYPNGHPAYQRDTVLCWTVGAQRGCGPTNIDSGFAFPAIRPDLLPAAGYPPVPTGHTGAALPAGTPVTITTPDGTELQSFRTAPDPRGDLLRLAGLFGATQANTGIRAFQTATVGEDLTTGKIIITPR